MIAQDGDASRFEPREQTNPPSLPDARPRSDRFRCGGRESKFLAIQPAPYGRPLKQISLSLR